MLESSIPTSSKLPKAAFTALQTRQRAVRTLPCDLQLSPPLPASHQLQTGHLHTHPAKPAHDGWLGSWPTVSDEVELHSAPRWNRQSRCALLGSVTEAVLEIGFTRREVQPKTKNIITGAKRRVGSTSQILFCFLFFSLWRQTYVTLFVTHPAT